MGMMINDLQNFSHFVGKIADGRCVEMTKDGGFALAKKTASAISRMFALTENARTAMENNNRVREAFVDALKRQFNVQDFSSLPTAVKAALVGSHAKTAEEDFGFDAQGHVTSGKPLTARRISAVLNAVEEINNQALDAVKTRKLDPQFIQSRKEALKPFIDKLFDKITKTQDGFEVPLISARGVAAARSVLDVYVTNKLAKIGAGFDNSLENIIGQIRTKICTGIDPAMDRYWSSYYTTANNNPTPGANGRERFVDKLMNELINEFNAANPDLKLDNEMVTTIASVTIKGEKVNKKVLPLLDVENLKDNAKFSLEMNKQQSKHGFDVFYSILTNGSSGINAISQKNPNIPKQFEKDFKRTTSYILPGIGKVSYHANDLWKAADDFAKSITKGRIQKFDDLKGDDLKKAQFVMTMMTQSSAGSIGMFINDVVFGKDEFGSTKATMEANDDNAVIGREENTDLSYELQVDDDGGVTVKAHYSSKINRLDLEVYDKNEELDSDGKPDYLVGSVKLDEDKSHYEVCMTVKYSKDKLNDIVSKDWNAMNEAELEKLVVADSREYELQGIHFEA